jgi:small-conductance mechanosensitive channel
VIRDAAAGVTLRLISPFGRGDYLSTDDLFGRITEIGIFYTEIQTEDRSLVTIMNTNLLSTNFETIPSSGTLLEARVSIGYDVHHENVELALKEAAEEYELEDPFVHVEDLGNYAVTYRVAGLLTDLENLLAARSDFRKKVLDKMHEHEIEIVSPDFLNRRDVNEKQFIPQKRTSDKKKVEKDEEAERTTEVVFEKALEAQEVEELEELLDRMEEQLANRKESGRTTERIQSKIEQVKQKKEQLEEELGDEE